MTHDTTLNTGLDAATRERIVAILASYLADSYVLLAKTHGAHWNVVGPHFRDHHKLFQSQYEELFEALDETAERIRAKGAPAPAALTGFAKASQLSEATGADEATGMQFMQTLLADHETLIRSLRQQITDLQEELGDDGTADYLTGRLQVHEKTAWMLRASLG